MADGVAMLQVRVGAESLQKLKSYSKKRGQTMTQLVTAWINGLGRSGVVEGAESPAVSGGGSEEPAVGTAEPVMVSTTPADLSSDELVVLGRRQVELLEQLVALNTEKPAIPVAAAEPAPAAEVAEVVITPPVTAEVEPAPVEPEPAPAAPTPALEGVAEVSAGVDEGVDLLAAQRARQLAELESWGQRHGAEVAAANKAEAEAALEAAMPSESPAVKKKVGNPEFLEKLKAAAAAAEADADTPMGGSEAGDLTEGASLDDTPEPAEGSGTSAIEVLAPADEGPILADASAGDDDLLKRVEALEKQERLMEDWLAAIRDGGDPVAPPLPEGASEQEWQAAATDCLEARGKKPLPELITAVLKHWGRG